MACLHAFRIFSSMLWREFFTVMWVAKFPCWQKASVEFLAFWGSTILSSSPLMEKNVIGIFLGNKVVAKI